MPLRVSFIPSHILMPRDDSCPSLSSRAAGARCGDMAGMGHQRRLPWHLLLCFLAALKLRLSCAEGEVLPNPTPPAFKGHVDLREADSVSSWTKVRAYCLQ